MSFCIKCSARYLKTPSWYFDKITEEFNPPSYWFRLKVFAKGRGHQRCWGHITRVWHSNGRRLKNFDPLVLFWISEPQISELQKGGNITQTHYKVDIAPGNYELAGLAHVKLPEIPLTEGGVLLPGQIPADQLPEIRIDHSKNERPNVSKVTSLGYGVYFIEVTVSDWDGNHSRKIFKIWGFPDPKKCQVRSSRFYERFLMMIKSFLPAI